VTNISDVIATQKRHIIKWLKKNGHTTAGGRNSSLLWKIATGHNLGRETRKEIATRTRTTTRVEVMEGRIQTLLDGPNPALTERGGFIHLSSSFKRHWDTRPDKGPLKTCAWPNGPKAINPTPPKRETTP